MHGDPGVFRQPGLHVGVLVGGVVVADDMQFHVRVVVGDEAEEVNEFLVRVLLVGLVGGEFSGRDVQRGEQGRGPVPFVVMGPGGRAALL